MHQASTPGSQAASRTTCMDCGLQTYTIAGDRGSAVSRHASGVAHQPACCVSTRTVSTCRALGVVHHAPPQLSLSRQPQALTANSRASMRLQHLFSSPLVEACTIDATRNPPATSDSPALASDIREPSLSSRQSGCSATHRQGPRGATSRRHLARSTANCKIRLLHCQFEWHLARCAPSMLMFPDAGMTWGSLQPGTVLPFRTLASFLCDATARHTPHPAACARCIDAPICSQPAPRRCNHAHSALCTHMQRFGLKLVRQRGLSLGSAHRSARQLQPGSAAETALAWPPTCCMRMAQD